MALPPDVANRLARDVESVSLPIISFSPVFTDTDLAEIVRVGGSVRQMAVAKRPKLSSRITTLLVEQGDEDVVADGLRQRQRPLLGSGAAKGAGPLRQVREVLQAVPIARPCRWRCPNA
jgi:uncharacterized protein (DUF2336 family)